MHLPAHQKTRLMPLRVPCSECVPTCSVTRKWIVFRVPLPYKGNTQNTSIHDKIILSKALLDTERVPTSFLSAKPIHHRKFTGLHLPTGKVNKTQALSRPQLQAMDATTAGRDSPPTWRNTSKRAWPGGGWCASDLTSSRRSKSSAWWPWFPPPDTPPEKPPPFYTF